MCAHAATTNTDACGAPVLSFTYGVPVRIVSRIVFLLPRPVSLPSLWSRNPEPWSRNPVPLRRDCHVATASIAPGIVCCICRRSLRSITINGPHFTRGQWWRDCRANGTTKVPGNSGQQRLKKDTKEQCQTEGQPEDKEAMLNGGQHKN